MIEIFCIPGVRDGSYGLLGDVALNNEDKLQ
jgi:hypothetical protein